MELQKYEIEHLDRLRPLLPECTVLLKKNGDFPLAGPGKIALYGNGVRRTVKGGTGSGEGSDRTAKAGDIFLTESEKRTILELKERYRKFLLVLNVGGVVDLSPVLEVENILILSQLGVQTGSTLADLVLGKTCPSGKLTTTWTRWEEYPGFLSFGEKDDTRYEEGIYVGYRYFDSIGKKALFPFGYGLSYTEFGLRFRALSLDKATVTVTAEVENTGAFQGKEVVQLYVSVPEGKLDQPYQALAAWKKTKELELGETETLSLTFSLTDLASYDTEQAAWILEKGDYILRLGNSSKDTQICGVLSVPNTLVTKRVKNFLPVPDFTDWSPERESGQENAGYAEQEETGDPVSCLAVDLSGQAAETVSYERTEAILPEAAGLDDEDLIRLNVGAFSADTGMAGIIGNS